MKRLRLCMSLAWEKIGEIISKSRQRFSGWLEKWTKKEDLSRIDHLNDDRCILCGAKLLFDYEITTRAGKTETAMFTCVVCGAVHKRKYMDLGE